MSQAILPMTSPESAPVPLIDLVEQFETQRDEILQAVERVFTKQAFILGDEVAGLEEEVATYCDSRFAIGCASGTDALILALMALDIGPGDEVITTPFTFFATASSIVRVGATPVFVDIEPTTYNLCPAAVEAAITSRTKAIMPVHLYGQCADMKPLWRVAVRHGLPIIEDACQAIGAAYDNRRTGVLGTIGCFSFFPTKNLGGAGDGGMLTTDDKDLNARLRRLRVHGDVGRYEHVEVGLNSRLDALQAAVLRIKLRKLDEWTAKRRENAARYDEAFASMGLQGVISTPATLAPNFHVYNQYCVRVHDNRRSELMNQLKTNQIGHAVYYPAPLHLQKCFQSLGYQAGQFPEAERASREIIALPIYAELGEARQQRVIRSVSKAFGVETGRTSIPMRRAA